MSSKLNGNFALLILLSILSQITSNEILNEIFNCTYYETVDLTGTQPFPNGSYEYAGVHIPVEYIGTYNYKVLFEGRNTSVPEYKRGCVCKFKPCIRYCCHRHRLDLEDDRKCIEEFEDFPVNITLTDESRKESTILKQFVLQLGIQITCNSTFHLWQYGNNDNWSLYEDGYLYRSDDNNWLTKQDYCLQPKEIASLGHNFKLMKMNCLEKPDVTIINLASIFFLLVTSCIYIFVLKLRHIHDKCYLCYLICQQTNSVVNIVVNREQHLFGAACHFVAYLGYFTGICIYLWLAVMAFDLWRKLVVHKFEVVKKKYRFLKYSWFVWGTATLLLSITILVDHAVDVLNIDSSWKVGFGYHECYAKMTDWSSVIYVFGPDAFLVSYNIILVAITVISLHRQNKNNRAELKEFGQKNMKNQMRFAFYLRFFSLAFMDFIIEFFAAIYVLLGTLPQAFFDVIYYAHFVHCVLIFVVTMARRDVIQALTKCVPQAKRTEVNGNDSDSHSTHELENNAECVRMHNLDKKFNFK